jgi:hypothetical protein
MKPKLQSSKKTKVGCEDCPASALWPWYGAGLWCFRAAYYLGKSTKPELCRTAKLTCLKEDQNASR